MNKKILLCLSCVALLCGMLRAQTKALDPNVVYPDNMIVPGECVAPFEQINFSITTQWAVSAGHGNTGVLVGDLDGNGSAEVICYNSGLNQIMVLDGRNGSTRATLAIPGIAATSGWHPTMTAVLVDADRNGKAEIIITKTDLTIMSYEVNVQNDVFSLVQKWPQAATFINPTSIAADRTPQPIVADFNGDGVPELVVYNRIFNAVTGAYLGETETITSAYVGRCASRSSNTSNNFQTAVDMDGDGLPEIVAGGKVYKVNIVDNGTRAECQTLYSNTAIGDGFTAVADIDMDGNLDVIVSTVQTGARLYVWSPIDNRIMANIQVASVSTQSYPFVGDIDGYEFNGKMYPEICINTGASGGMVYAYKYDVNTNTIVQKWTLKTSDSSGGTGITLFDFNKDGINELVYRDETLLRILNGVEDNKTPVLASPDASISCTSGTAFEYPVIADITGEGSANICVTGSGRVNVFKSGGSPWVPARPVWNQVNYEPTMINKDLTVPTSVISKNMEIHGIHPYNGALIQVPIVDRETYEPIIESADPAAERLWVEPVNNSTVRLWFRIKNLGERLVNSDLPIALYGVNPPPTPPTGMIATKPIGNALTPGGTVEMYFDVPISQLTNSMSARIQDNGAAFPVVGFLDCNLENNVIDLHTYGDGFDDYYGCPLNSPISGLDVLNNDKVPVEGGDPVPMTTLLSATSAEGATVSITGDNKLNYTAPAGFSGVDVVSYWSTGMGPNNVPLMVSAKAYIYVFERSKKACPEGVNIQINDVPNDILVNWFDAASGNNSKNNLPGAAQTHSLYAEVTFEVSGTPIPAFNNRIAASFTVETIPSLMYWNTNAISSNWNEPKNWTNAAGVVLNAVPLSCTDVHIPGNAVRYPSLDPVSTPRGIYDDPICRNITFHFGAEVAKPHLLTYEKAYIQYNFGYYDAGNNYRTDGDAYSAAPMLRGRWYALSAPLKKIASGDFSFGGYPNVWQQGFKVSEAGNSWYGEWDRPNNDNAFDIAKEQNHAITIWAGAFYSNPDSLGLNDHKHLNALKGIVEMPYYENAAVSKEHRIHTYSTVYKKSFFWYYYPNIPNLPIEYGYPRGEIARDGAYRFVFDDLLKRDVVGDTYYNIRVPVNKEVMIGNPFLSSLDFDRLYSNNADKLKPYYRIYENGSWLTFDVNLGIHPVLTKDIASYQAFFVSTITTPGIPVNDSVDLNFYPDQVSVTRTAGSGHQLKTGTAENPNVLYLRTKNASGSSYITLGYGSSVEGKSNIYQLFSTDNSVPQLYAVDANNQKNAVQYVSDLSAGVPLGIMMTGGKVELDVLNPENVDFGSLMLYDRKKEQLIDLKELKGHYEFDNDPSYPDRFVLSVRSATGLEDLPEIESMQVYVSSGDLVISSSKDIAEVVVTNLQGVRIWKEQVSGRDYRKNIRTASGVYIVTVTDVAGNQKSVRVIL